MNEPQPLIIGSYPFSMKFQSPIDGKGAVAMCDLDRLTWARSASRCQEHGNLQLECVLTTLLKR